MPAVASPAQNVTSLEGHGQTLPRSFNRSAFGHLSPADQVCFEVFGRGPATAPTFELLHEAFEAHAAAQPEVIALEHLGETVTYGALDRKAERLAAVLTAQGVTQGDAVGLFVQRSIPMVVGILATLKVGAAYVPQHIGVAPEAQLRHVMQAAGTSVVLTQSTSAHLVPESDGHIVIAIDDVLAGAAHLPSRKRAGRVGQPSDRCFILFTSGTTGPPNGVQVTHRNVCNIVLTEPGNLGITPGTRVGQILSIAFDMAAWEIFGSLGNGGTLVLRGADFQQVAAEVDVLIATPTVLGSIDASAATNVKTVAVAGEPCPRPLADSWGAFATFYNSCGPTETTIVNTAEIYRPGDELLTIGRPTPNNTVYVLDENRRPLPIGEVGRMWAGGVCVTEGYLDNAALNAERYAPDPFLGEGHTMFDTRDLGRWTADGSLEHFGRTDDQVKVRGFRVELDSVSATLETAPGCSKAVTLKLNDRELAAVVSPGSVDVEGARAAVREALPYYCVPAVVLAMDEMPMTARGKVDKRAILGLAELASGPSDARKVVAA
jgi:amino acid adenylation domain-containing protein